MILGEIGKDSGIEGKSRQSLQCQSLGGGFHCDVFHAILAKLLEECVKRKGIRGCEGGWECFFFALIVRVLVSNRTGECGFLSTRLEYGMYEVCCRGFTVGTCNTDKFKVSRRIVVPIGRNQGHCTSPIRDLYVGNRVYRHL